MTTELEQRMLRHLADDLVTTAESLSKLDGAGYRQAWDLQHEARFLSLDALDSLKLIANNLYLIAEEEMQP